MPIYDIEAEQSVLGSILQQPELLNKVKGILEPEHFYQDRHKIIYKAIIKAYNDKKPIDAITIAGTLRESGELEKIGGMSYLLTLFDYIVPANIVFHSKLIVEKAIMREIRSSSIEAKDGLTEADIKKYLDKLQALYNKLSLLDVIQKEPSGFSVDSGVELLKKAPEGKRTGYPKIDEIVRFNPSELIIIGARTKHGKTTFAMNLLLNMSKLYPNEAFIFFTYEVNYMQFFTKMLSWASGESFYKIRDCYRRQELTKEIYDGQEKLREYEKQGNIFIVDEPTFDTDKILAYCQQVKKSKPIGAVFVDYIELVREEADTEELRIAEITHKLRVASQILDAPIIALAQMNRASVDKKKIEQRRPTLEGLRYSGRQEQEATTVLGLFNIAREKMTMLEEQGLDNEEQRDITDLEVIFLKCRYAQSNQTIKLTYDMKGNKIT